MTSQLAFGLQLLDLGLPARPLRIRLVCFYLISSLRIPTLVVETEHFGGVARSRTPLFSHFTVII